MKKKPLPDCRGAVFSCVYFRFLYNWKSYVFILVT